MLRVITPLLFLAACASGGGTAPTSPTPTPALDEEFILAPGQAALVKDTEVRITFDRVSEDSRCPTDVTCIWEGDAVVVLRVKAAADEATRELHTQGDPPRSRRAPAGDYVVTLVRLDPAPLSTAPVAASAYRATLRVSRD